MFRWIIQWILSAVALMIATRIIPGFYITGLNSALLAALAIGLVNATLGYFLKFVSFPLVILMFGAVILFINVAILVLASRFVDGFYVYGTTPAVWAAAALAVLSLIIRFTASEE